MSYKPSDAYSKEFVTSSPTTGAATNADSLPTATADFDGSGTGAMSLTVANLDAGRYKITGTIPAGRVKGDVLNVSVAATVGGVAGKAVVDTQQIDSKRVGDLNDAAALTDYQQRAVAVTLPSIPANWITSSGVAASALNGKGDWLTTLGSTAPANWINTAAFTSTGVTIPDSRLGYLTGPVALASQIPASFTTATFASPGVFSSSALANAPSGGSGGATAGQIATAVWQDLLSGSDFTTTGSVGAKLAALTVSGGKVAATLNASDVTGNLPADLQTIKTQAVTASTGVTFPASIGTSTYSGGAVASVTGNVGGNVAGSVGSVTAAVTVGTVNDKTGYSLAASGLDSIAATAPTHGTLGSWTFPQMLMWLVRRFKNNTTLTASNLIVRADDATTVITTQSVADDGTTQTQGAAS